MATVEFEGAVHPTTSTSATEMTSSIHGSGLDVIEPALDAEPMRSICTGHTCAGHRPKLAVRIWPWMLARWPDFRIRLADRLITIELRAFLAVSDRRGICHELVRGSIGPRCCLSLKADPATSESPNGQFAARSLLQRLGAGDDLDQLLGDLGLACAVVAHRQLVDHLAGVAGGAVHGAHACALLGGGVLQQPAEDLR